MSYEKAFGFQNDLNFRIADKVLWPCAILLKLVSLATKLHFMGCESSQVTPKEDFIILISHKRT